MGSSRGRNAGTHPSPPRQAASNPACHQLGQTAQSLAADPRTELPGIPQGICFLVANSSDKSPTPKDRAPGAMHRQTRPSRQLPSRYSERVQEESHIQGATSKSAKVSSLNWDTPAFGPPLLEPQNVQLEEQHCSGKDNPTHVQSQFLLPSCYPASEDLSPGGIGTNSVPPIHAPCLLPCWNLGGPGGTSWFGSTGGSGVRVSNCSLLIIFTFLKFSTSCCIGRGR